MSRTSFRLPSLLACGLLFGLAVSLLPAPAYSRQELKPPADFKAYVETIPGSAVKFEMLPIPGGTVRLGSPLGEAGRLEDEGPQVEVQVGPFWMGKFEVTWDEFDLFAFSLDLKKEKEAQAPAAAVGTDGVTRPTPPYTDMTFGFGHDKYPAICMTHHAAMEYCRWLSKKTGKTYRLPTEAEWEHACRAGTKTAYSFGDDPAKLDEYGWNADNADGKPHPVGGKKPNPWGLFDMHGNVAEWCVEHYAKDRYAALAKDKLLKNPVLPPTEKRFSHTVRGGSWDQGPEECRSASRKGSNREWMRQDPQRPQSIWWLTEAVYVGFRVVRPVEELPELKDLKSKVVKTSPYGP